MSKIKPVLEGYVRFRDGKKWKKRYCVLCLSQTSPNALHIYMMKNYDEFDPYRSTGYMSSAHLPVSNINASGQPHGRSKTVPSAGMNSGSSTLVSAHTILANLINRSTSAVGQNSGSNFSGSASQAFKSNPYLVVNSAVLAAHQASVNGLSQASALAAQLNAPGPMDEITGFESGRHMEKESNVMVFIGASTVYAIAHDTMDVMFHWADILGKIIDGELSSNSFDYMSFLMSKRLRFLWLAFRVS